MANARLLEVDATDELALADAAQLAALVLEAGGLVVLPTDTVYGLACRPDLAGATKAVFQAKRRPAGLSLPVLAAGEAVAWEVARPDERARLLASRFWPGPLTMVLPRAPRSAGWTLGEAERTVAVRVPSNPLARRVLQAAGPLAVTSANRSGQPPLSSLASMVEALGDAVELYLTEAGSAWDGGSTAASTVVDLTRPAAGVTREGPVSARAIADALKAFDIPPERPSVNYGS